jgi:hypothetical protein
MAGPEALVLPCPVAHNQRCVPRHQATLALSPAAPLPLSLSLSLSYRKGMISARPLYVPGRLWIGLAVVWDPEPSKERVGDWGGPATVWSLLCVAETRATRPNGEWGYSTRRQCCGPRVPSGGVTLKRRCTYRPSVIYLIVNKLLSLSLSLSPSQCSGILRIGHSHPSGPQIAEGEVCTWRRATRLTFVQLDAVSVAQLGRNSQKSVSRILTTLRHYRAHFSEFAPCAASLRARLP